MVAPSKQYKGAFPVLVILLAVVTTLSMCFGAVYISMAEIFSAIRKVFSSSETMSLNERIFLGLRLPRALLCVFVGASLAVGGVLMQALFRNPIVEQGLHQN